MSINLVHSFLDHLNLAVSPGNYLTQELNTFKVIDLKSNKNLTTQSISFESQKCFNTIKNSPDLSRKEKSELMKKLKLTIKAYDTRVYNSKKWYQKLGSFFGFVSKEEKALASTSKLATAEIKTYEKALKEFASICESYAEHRKEFEGKDDKFVKKIYMKNFGGLSTQSKMPDLEGFSQSGGMYSYLEDLKSYRSVLLNNKQSTQNIDRVIAIISKAYGISLLSDYINHKFTYSNATISKNDLKNELLLQVREEIMKLNVGDLMLLPGGFIQGNEGHAVLYEIKKTGPNTCSFTIINAGKGAKKSTSPKAVGIGLFNAFASLVKDRNVLREQVKNIRYENVPLDLLNKDFLKEILTQRFTASSDDPMAHIKQKIDNKLLTGQVNKTEGREHSSQEIGSCTFKSISTWTKEAFNNDSEYNKFKAFTTEKDIDQLLKMKPQTNQIKELIKDGQAVLAKRTNKANL